MFEKFSISRADIWFFLVCLLTISFPWNERINSLFILLLGVFWLCDLNLPAKVLSLRQNWKKILPFWLFILLHILFLPRAIHMQDALHTIEVKLTFLLLPLFFATENYLDAKNKRRLFTLFCYSCLLSAVYCVITYIIYFYPTLQWTKFFDRIYFSEYTMHPGYYSNFFVIAVIYLSLSLIEERRQEWQRKTVSIVLILIFLAVLLILISKTAILLLMLFSIYLIWTLLNTFRQKYIRFLLFAAITFITFLIFSTVPSIQKRILETKNDWPKADSSIKFENSTGSRIAAWTLEWELIREHWVLGYGTGNANHLLQKKFIERHYTDLEFNKMHTHNQILHTWIDVGIAGIVCLLSIFIFCLIYFYKIKNNLGIWSVLLLALYCLTDDALEIQAITVFCIFMICILLFENNKQVER